ncbi:MoxR family ATPase [Treponema sp. OMZ 840]|uniref:AAA family ATPase n=1 Tax=Treponema sp. OMZ 840 TaxID=244313 RepID=UPI003D8C3BF2
MLDKTTNKPAEDFEYCRTVIEKCRSEAAKRIIGQTQVIDGILTALIADGHILLEGVPGLAKTLAVKTFADMSGFAFKRIQFTPDLLPADITGTLIYEQAASRFSVRKGPVFTNLLLADEINRSPAKVQSALLEAMGEYQVTIGEESFELPKPFFVMATQNPIDQEGTYNLPEAELDRFLLKILLTYPSGEEEQRIIKGGGRIETIPVNRVFDAQKLDFCRSLLEAVTCTDDILRYIVSIVHVTRPDKDKKSAGVHNAAGFTGTSNLNRSRTDILKYLAFGASPRASIALSRCAKVRALFAGRSFVLPEDVKAAAPEVLRHRLILSYEAAADNVSADELIEKILSLMPVP